MAAPLVNVYYTKPIMPDVSRVLACLYEKRIEFEPIHIYEGQHSVSMDLLKLRSRASKRINGVAMEDGDTRLFESRAICRYLGEKYSGRGTSLLGKDPLERAAIEQWLKFEEHKFDPPSWSLAFYLAFAPPPPDAAAVRDGVRKLAEVLDVYEQRLAESEFLAGDEFTMADLFHLPNSHHILASSSSHPAYPEVSDLFYSRTNVCRWWRTISGRPSWKNVVDLLNGVPIKRTSLLSSAPESARTDRSSYSPAGSTAQTRAGAASQLRLPPSQSAVNVGTDKASSKPGDEAASGRKGTLAELAASKLSLPFSPGLSPRLNKESKEAAEQGGYGPGNADTQLFDLTSNPEATAKAAPQDGVQTPEPTGGENAPARPASQLSEGGKQSRQIPVKDGRSQPKPESQRTSSSLAKAVVEAFTQADAETGRPKDTKAESTRGESGPPRPDSQQSVSSLPVKDVEKASPQAASGDRKIPGRDGAGTLKPDSRGPASSQLRRNAAEGATQTTIKPSSEKPEFKGDNAEHTEIDRTVAPQSPGPSLGNIRSIQAASASGTSPSARKTVGETIEPRSNQLEPSTETNTRSRLSSFIKEAAEASPHAVTEREIIPGKDGAKSSTLDSQSPASPLSPGYGTSADTRSISKTATDSQQLKRGNGEPNKTDRDTSLLPPAPSSPGSGEGAQASRQGGNRSQDIQAVAERDQSPGKEGAKSSTPYSQQPTSSLSPGNRTPADTQAIAKKTATDSQQLRRDNGEPNKTDRDTSLLPPAPSPGSGEGAQAPRQRGNRASDTQAVTEREQSPGKEGAKSSTPYSQQSASSLSPGNRTPADTPAIAKKIATDSQPLTRESREPTKRGGATAPQPLDPSSLGSGERAHEATQAGNSARPIQAPAEGSSPSNPGRAGGATESSSKRTGGKGDDPGTPNADTDTGNSTSS